MNINCFLCNSSEFLKTMNGVTYCKVCLDEEKKALLKYEESRTKLFPEINQIIADKLYIGNYDQARHVDSLIDRNITHVLVCGAYMNQFYPDKFIYEQFEIEDTIEEDISKYFKKAIEFIDNSKIVFVHCHAGISRSATIVIAYIMYKYKMKFEVAYQYVKERRKIILPNQNFKNQLKMFEKEIL